ncbi:hypothetical protein LCGC14_2193730 [marine sediment metagenome]|uniref:Uncharacterized protein n=1 Tax=marine sediment metagenome TaxID=412755 RepID=A0A0F9FW74_9ZZZZ
MALRKPIVIVNGQMQQLQSGDTLDASANEVDVVDMTNNNASPIVIGNTVFCDAAGGVDLAQANAAGTVEVLGFVKPTSIAAASSGSIQTDGILAATTVQWDAVAGTTGGLTPGTVYYLDPTTPGNITETAPTSGGQYVIRVGKAIRTTELEISITEPILL